MTLVGDAKCTPGTLTSGIILGGVPRQPANPRAGRATTQSSLAVEPASAGSKVARQGDGAETASAVAASDAYRAPVERFPTASRAGNACHSVYRARVLRSLIVPIDGPRPGIKGTHPF